MNGTMKCFPVLLVCCVLFSSCNTTPTPPAGKSPRKPYIAEKEFPADKELPIDIPPAPSPDLGIHTFCYELREGEEGKDITTMRIYIQNDSVTGTMDYLPFERDASHGTVHGRKEGKFLEIVFDYTTEGQHQMEEMEFKMERDKIYKKDGELILKDSVLVLKNPNKATFSLEMQKVNCK